MITPNHQEVAVHLLRTYHVVEPISEGAGQYLGRIIDGAYGGTDVDRVEESGTARLSSLNAPCNVSSSYACSTSSPSAAAPSVAAASPSQEMPLSKKGGREVVRAGRAAAVDAAGEDEDEGEGCAEEA